MIVFDPHDPFTWMIELVFSVALYWPVYILFALAFIGAAIKKIKWLMWFFASPFILWAFCAVILILKVATQ